MTPVVSVIVPVYRRERELAELLDSLSAQTMQQFEVLLVNNDGPDKRSLLAPYENLDIRYIELGENHHVKARNLGVNEARGTYILLLDDDDALLPTHIEECLQDLQEADFVFTDAELFRFEWRDDTRHITSREPFAYELDLERLRQDSIYIPSGSMYRKELHDELGMFDESVYNYWDWDWILRVAGNHRIVHPPRATVLYAFNGTDNLSAQQDEERRRYFERFCEKHDLREMTMKNFQIVQEERRAFIRETRRDLTASPLGKMRRSKDV